MFKSTEDVLGAVHWSLKEIKKKQKEGNRYMERGRKSFFNIMNLRI